MSVASQQHVAADGRRYRFSELSKRRIPPWPSRSSSFSPTRREEVPLDAVLPIIAESAFEKPPVTRKPDILFDIISYGRPASWGKVLVSGGEAGGRAPADRRELKPDGRRRSLLSCAAWRTGSSAYNNTVVMSTRRCSRSCVASWLSSGPSGFVRRSRLPGRAGGGLSDSETWYWPRERRNFKLPGSWKVACKRSAQQRADSNQSGGKRRADVPAWARHAHAISTRPTSWLRAISPVLG